MREVQVCQPLHHKVSYRDVFPSLSGSDEERQGVRAALLGSLRSLLLAGTDAQLALVWKSLLGSLFSEAAGPGLLAVLEVPSPPFLLSLSPPFLLSLSPAPSCAIPASLGYVRLFGQVNHLERLALDGESADSSNRHGGWRGAAVLLSRKRGQNALGSIT